MTGRIRSWLRAAAVGIAALTVACSTTIAGSAVKAPGEARGPD